MTLVEITTGRAKLVQSKTCHVGMLSERSFYRVISENQKLYFRSRAEYERFVVTRDRLRRRLRPEYDSDGHIEMTGDTSDDSTSSDGGWSDHDPTTDKWDQPLGKWGDGDDLTESWGDDCE